MSGAIYVVLAVVLLAGCAAAVYGAIRCLRAGNNILATVLFVAALPPGGLAGLLFWWAAMDWSG